MTDSVKKKPLIMKQKPMFDVLYALIPICIASVYFFGWRSLVVLFVVNIFGFATEYFYLKAYKESVSSAIFVTNTLFALILPPTIPLWMAVVGIVFGVLFGKMVFGGFGRNIFNPALVGRVFLYINFGVAMTGTTAWREPLCSFTTYLSDAVTTATPMKVLTQGQGVAGRDLLLGTTSGCLGETSAILIILAGIFLIWRKVANYRIVISGLLAAAMMHAALYFGNVPNAVDPLSALLSGGFMFGLIFMATDPVSAAQTDKGRWIYGAFIGIVTALIRTFSVWPEGIMFAILLGNMFAPIVDYTLKKKKTVKAV